MKKLAVVLGALLTLGACGSYVPSDGQFESNTETYPVRLSTGERVECIVYAYDQGSTMSCVKIGE